MINQRLMGIIEIFFSYISADGIALGAAIKLSETHITMIVFVAIMLHKVRRIAN